MLNMDSNGLTGKQLYKALKECVITKRMLKQNYPCPTMHRNERVNALFNGFTKKRFEEKRGGNSYRMQNTV